MLLHPRSFPILGATVTVSDFWLNPLILLPNNRSRVLLQFRQVLDLIGVSPLQFPATVSGIIVSNHRLALKTTLTELRRGRQLFFSPSPEPRRFRPPGSAALLLGQRPGLDPDRTPPGSSTVFFHPARKRDDFGPLVPPHFSSVSVPASTIPAMAFTTSSRL